MSYFNKFVIVLFFLFLFLGSAVFADNYERCNNNAVDIGTGQCLALAEFYEATQGDNRTDSSGWFSGNTACAGGWTGIYCGFPGDVVVEIMLESNNLVGYLPYSYDFVGNLIGIFIISLGGNNIGGEFPASWSGFDNLNTIYLNDNNISGELPASWSGLANLETLFARNNFIYGSVPSDWIEFWDEAKLNNGLGIAFNDNCMNTSGYSNDELTWLNTYATGWDDQNVCSDKYISFNSLLTGFSGLDQYFNYSIIYGNSGYNNITGVDLKLFFSGGVTGLVFDSSYEIKFLNKTYFTGGDFCYEDFYDDTSGEYYNGVRTFMEFIFADPDAIFGQGNHPRGDENPVPGSNFDEQLINFSTDLGMAYNGVTGEWGSWFVDVLLMGFGDSFSNFYQNTVLGMVYGGQNMEDVHHDCGFGGVEAYIFDIGTLDVGEVGSVFVEGYFDDLQLGDFISVTGTIVDNDDINTGNNISVLSVDFFDLPDLNDWSLVADLDLGLLTGDSYLISGTGIIDANILIYSGGDVLYSGSVDGSGNWSLDIDLSNLSGSYSYYIYQSLFDQLSSGYNISFFVFVLDNIFMDKNQFTGFFGDDLVLTGYGTSGAYIEIYCEGFLLNSGFATSNNWSLDINLFNTGNYACEVLQESLGLTGKFDFGLMVSSMFYIDPSGGDDSNTGDVNNPLASLTGAFLLAGSGDYIQIPLSMFVSSSLVSTSSINLSIIENISGSYSVLGYNNFSGTLSGLIDSNKYMFDIISSIRNDIDGNESILSFFVKIFDVDNGSILSSGFSLGIYLEISGIGDDEDVVFYRENLDGSASFVATGIRIGDSDVFYIELDSNSVYGVYKSSADLSDQPSDPSPSGGGAGGGRWFVREDLCDEGALSSMGCDEKLVQPDKEEHSKELILNCYYDEYNQAYKFAFLNNITTMPSCIDANMDGYLIRAHAAKMISNFLLNELGRVPDESKKCEFDDMSNQNYEMQYYAKMACQLGVMGIAMESFYPNDYLNKAQLSTIISRILFGDKHDNKVCRYCDHVNVVFDLGIIKFREDLFGELKRAYAMIMLERVGKFAY